MQYLSTGRFLPSMMSWQHAGALHPVKPDWLVVEYHACWSTVLHCRPPQAADHLGRSVHVLQPGRDALPSVFDLSKASAHPKAKAGRCRGLYLTLGWTCPC